MSSSPNRSADSPKGVSTTNRILLAAYHFPPSAAVGGLRVTRFARYLPQFGWEPYVITVDDTNRDHEEGVDCSRLAGLEQVLITRTRALRGVLAFYGRVKSHLPGRPSQAVRVSLSPSSSHEGEGRQTEGRESLSHRLKRYAASFWFLLPDPEKNWSLPAAFSAIRLIRKHHIDYVLTSGPPFSVHFIGLAAKAFTNAKWVADFRDPWFEMLTGRAPQLRSKLSNEIEAWMEAKVMRGADKVLATTERMRKSMVERYPGLPADKFVYLPNGIDVGRTTEGSPVQKYKPLTITYAGTLYFDRTPEPLFEAFGSLVKEGKASTSDFRIKLLGSCRTIGGVDTKVVARRYNVEEAVEIIDRVPHGEAVEIMRRSHLLLVLAPPNHQLVLPAKIFDYFGSGSKLLALAEPGATSDLMLETGGGRCFSQNDVCGLKEYFHELLKDGQYRDLRNEPELFAKYDARHLTGQLVAELSDDHVHPEVARAQT